MISWYLSEVGDSFTEILEAIAIEKGYKEGDGKITEKNSQGKPRRRPQPLTLEPSASISTVISE